MLFLLNVRSIRAQTPFNPPFGFFGSSTAKNATPWVNITSPADNDLIIIANQASVTVSGTCSIPGRNVVISSGIITPLGTTLCGIGRSFTLNVDVTSVADGLKPLTATLTNALGAAGTDTVTIDKDTTAPVIGIPAVGPLGGGISGTINFTVTEAHATTSNYTLEISNDGGGSWAALGTVAGVAGNLSAQAFSYTWNPVSSWNINNARVRITGADANTYSTTETSANFVVDSTAPTVSFISINSGAGNTTSRAVVLDATGADDALTNITSFCFKYDTTATPLSTDGCWIPVTSTPPNLVPATTLNLISYPFQLPPIFGAHNFYVWLKNEAGLISTLTNSGAGTVGVDLSSIVYTPTTPPTIINAISSSTDTPSTPASSTDLTVASGNTVYIKWTASDDMALPATPISIYYTLDDITYTLVATNISNSANAGCTLTGAATGCYTWVNGSPTNAYFKIRVRVTDSDTNTAQTSSAALNISTQLNVLAGNTDPGTDGSASAAIFANQTSAPAIADPKSLVVSSTGIIYFLDYRRGLLKVDPNTGNQTIVIPETGVRSGDGGPINSATLKDPIAIVIDYQDNVYIWDDSRIRKIDFLANTINVLIGGGASTATTPIAATSLSIHSTFADWNDYRVLMVPLPNGDLILRTDDPAAPILTNHRYRVYRGGTGLVETLFSISGNRDMTSAGQDVTLCRAYFSGFSFNMITSAITDVLVGFAEMNNGACPGLGNTLYLSTADPTTGVLQAAPYPSNPVTGVFSQMSKLVLNNGLDGKIYAVSRSDNYIYRYNVATKDWTNLVGNGTRGSCTDGTLATACAIDPLDVFVTQNATLYFVDRGKIRMVDPISNKVYTLYGQPFNFGDGGIPLSARFNTVGNVKLWNSAGTDKFIVFDSVELRFREFSENGTISTIAGDGSEGAPNTTSAASAQVIGSATATAGWLNFLVDPTNGNIWYNRGLALAYLNRTTDRWVDFVGNGSTHYASADGLTGANIKWNGSYYPYMIDFDSSGNILAGSYTYGIPSTNNFIKAYDKTTSVQSHVVGNAIMTSDYSICVNGNNDLTCDLPLQHSILSIWDTYTNTLLLAGSSGSSTADIKKVNIGIGTVTTYKTLPRTVNSLAYYRDAGLTVEKFYYCKNGTLYKYNNLTSTENVITFPEPNMICSDQGIFYSSSRGSLIVGVKKNGLGAVVEIFNP